MTSKKFVPYTYLIGWSHHNKYYYGVRYCKNCNPSDFWKTYFTSSKKVKDFRKCFGEPDIIQIRKTFCNIDSARLWEHKVLKRMNVVLDNRFLNQTDNKAFVPLVGSNNPMYGNTHSLEAKDKIRKSKLGKNRKPFSKETKEKMSKNRTGRKRKYNENGSWHWHYPEI
jgi:hypothetical protein